MRNILSVDVEEYFHPTEIGCQDPSRWADLPSRIESQTARVLEMFSRHGAQGTFFILGWVAEQRPHLVRRIAEAGHEIGCHSHLHRLVYDLSPEEFRRDTRRAVAAIENACGIRPRTYRAPSYSITARSMWALQILVEEGFVYDSSIYPIAHDRYGIPGFERHAKTLTTPAGPIHEIPIATVQLGKARVAPIGGGAYLRLLPYRYTAAGIRHLNETEQQPACIYFHPWELDADQPRMAPGFLSSLRTYTGVKGMASKLDRLMSDFQFSPIAKVHTVPELHRVATNAY